MNSDQPSYIVRQKMAKYTQTNVDDWYLALKARYGMATCLKAIRAILGGGEVITTPFTCITAVNPIIAAGFKPVYADIDQTTLSIKNIEDLITDKTRAVIVQHTFGIINPEIKVIKKLAKQHNFIIIEDSAHALTRLARDSNDVPISDISIHSFGVEKILQSTKFGGAVFINPTLKQRQPKLFDELTSKLINLPPAPSILDIKTRLYRTQNAIIQRTPNRLKGNLRNLLLHSGIYEPAIIPAEQTAEQPQSYAITNYVCENILKKIDSIPANLNQRARNVEYYQKYLKNSSYFHIVSEKKEPLLIFPVIFNDTHRATEAYNALISSGFYIRRWYSPLLYPGPVDNRLYSYNPKMAPTAESIHTKILGLPTDLSIADTKKIINIIFPVQNHVQNYQKYVENSLKTPKNPKK